MSAFLIPIENAAEDGAFFFRVDLDGVDYQISFQYNTREGFWYFDLLDADGEIIRSGIKCVGNWPLLYRMVDQGRPPGELLTLDTRPTPVDPTLESLGLDASLIYDQYESES